MILYNDVDQPVTAISYNSALLANLKIFLSYEGLSLRVQTPEEFFSSKNHNGSFLNLIQKDIELREKITDELDKTSTRRFSYVHNSSDIIDQRSIGPGVFVWPNCTIDRNTKIEKDVIICSQSLIGHSSSIGVGSYIAPGVLISGSTTVGKFCYLGIGSILIDHIEICDRVTTGAGTIIRKSVKEPGTYVNQNQIEKLA